VVSLSIQQLKFKIYFFIGKSYLLIKFIEFTSHWPEFVYWFTILD